MAVVDLLTGVAQDLAIKAPCIAATTGANIALSGVQTIDGVTVGNNNERVLVKDQSDPTTNGIYNASAGLWQRAVDANNNTQFAGGMAVLAAQGTVNAGSLFVCTCTDNPVVIGTSLITFALQTALQNAQVTATSTTSLAIGTGAKAFTTQAGKNFAVNQWVLAYSRGNNANAMFGQVTAYSGTTLTVNVTSIGGAGTAADWNIVLANSAAAAGIQPPVGTGNTTGAGSSTAGNIATFADGTGKVLADSGKQLGTLATRNNLVYGDAGTATVPAAALTADVMRTPLIGQPGVSENFLLSNDGANPTRDVDIGPGRCEDDSFTTKLRLKGTMVKRLDQAWAAGGTIGASVGGTDAGGVKGVSQTLHAYVIGAIGLSVTQFSRTSNVATVTITGHPLGVGGTIAVQGVGSGIDGDAVITAVTVNTVSYANAGPDIGATACSATANGFDVLFARQDVHAYPSPALPTLFTVKQCLGSVITDGSGNIRAFTQVGDLFVLGTPVAEITNTAPGDTNAHTLTLTGVPIGVALIAQIQAAATLGATGYLSALAAADQVPSVTASPGCNYGNTSGSVNVGMKIDVLTNASGQVRYRLNTNNAQTIVTVGWRDPRRRLI
jgi:hypothetical protein